MLTIKECKFTELKKGITAAYKEDTEGLKKYVDPVLTLPVNTIKQGINEQYNKLKDYKKDGKELRNYLVYKSDVLIGYFTYLIENDICFLVSFGISVKYRKTKNTLSDFFFKIESVLGNKFCCILWDKNTRAVKWLLKNGMRISGKTECENNHLTILVKN